MAYDWKEATMLRKGNVVALINRALLENGNVFHSVRISRIELGDDGEPRQGAKPTQYLRPTDMDDLEGLAEEARYWVQADIEEIRTGKSSD